jgi:hypothetical protein
MMILVETPFGEFFELFQGSVWVFDNFGGHETDLVLAGTTFGDDGVPLALLIGAHSVVFLLSHFVELLDGVGFEVDLGRSLLGRTSLLIVVLHFH